MKRTFRLYNIKWDTDDFDEADACAMGTDEPLWELPSEVEVEFDWDPSEDELADYLSDTYGFCVDGFEYEEIAND